MKLAALPIFVAELFWVSSGLAAQPVDPTVAEPVGQPQADEQPDSLPVEESPSVESVDTAETPTVDAASPEQTPRYGPPSPPPPPPPPPPPAPPPPPPIIATQLCSGFYSACVTVTGRPGLAFFVVKKTTFTKFATSNGTKPYSVQRAIDKVSGLGKNMQNIAGNGSLTFRLGQYGQDYFLIPLCNQVPDFQRSQQVRMLNAQQSYEVLACPA